MNIFEEAEKNCFMGIKAFQNIRAATYGFERMLEIHATLDTKSLMEITIMSSLFTWSAVRYVKPFLNSRLKEKEFKYPLKSLKKASGFSLEIHNHLISLRNTLIAHDDFDVILPKLFRNGETTEEENLFIPTTITLSNKCIGFPSDASALQRIVIHSQACLKYIKEKFDNDVINLRMITITHPELSFTGAKPFKIGKTLETEESQGISTSEYLNYVLQNTPIPEFAEKHGIYMYENCVLARYFHIPEKITLPSGKKVKSPFNFKK